jgi:CheY-like chemotaxis protein
MSSTPRVLVVDDEPDFLEMVEERLSRDERFEVFAVGTAADAIAAVEDRSVDCVVTDSLVLDTGKPLVNAVRERDETLPLIYYTGKEWDEVADTAVAAGVSDYVQKGAGSIAEVARRIDVAVHSDVDAGVEAGEEQSGTPHERFTIAALDVAGNGWEVVGVFDPGGDVELSVLLAQTLTEYLDLDAESFVLYDWVDADALEALLLSRDGAERRPITVRFPLDGHLVAVTSAGEIAVRDRSLSE